jgi:hypothetical protein
MGRGLPCPTFRKTVAFLKTIHDSGGTDPAGDVLRHSGKMTASDSARVGQQ